MRMPWIAIHLVRSQEEKEYDRSHADRNADSVAAPGLEGHYRAKRVAGSHYPDPRHDRVENHQRRPVLSKLNRTAEVEDLPERSERALGELLGGCCGQKVHQVVEENHPQTECSDGDVG